MVKFDKEFMENNWKAWMGVTYMLICLFDFMGAPVLWSAIQFWENEAANDAFRQWAPLTLQGGGFFHMAMGAVLGISALNKDKKEESSDKG
jgi:hypothetical protein